MYWLVSRGQKDEALSTILISGARAVPLQATRGRERAGSRGRLPLSLKLRYNSHMLSPDRLQRLRDQLLEEQNGLQEDLDNLRPDQLVTDSNAGVGNHPAEDADLTWQQEQIASLRLNQQNIVDRIKHALKLMDDGTYGICERCGQEIDYARLKAEPYATLCIHCQRVAER